MRRHVTVVGPEGLVALLGAVAFLGWVLDVGTLKSLYPGLPEMKANTAVAFVLAAVSARLLQPETTGRARSMVGCVCAGAVSLIGLLTLAEHAFGSSFGIDELLFHDGNPVAGTAPGRMALNTAVAFALAGAALLLLRVAPVRPSRSVEILAVAVGAIGFLAFTGHLYGVRALESGFATRLAPMALDTAVAFMLLAAAILAARPRGRLMALVTSRGPGGVLIRRLVMPAVVLGLLIGWLRFELAKRSVLEPETASALYVLVTVLVIAALILVVADALNRVDTERQLEHRRRADALRTSAASERKFRALMESAPDAIVITDTEGRIVLVNRLTEEVLGYGRDELIGQPVEVLLPDQFRAAHAGHRDRYQTDPGLRAMGGGLELVARRKDGSVVPVEIGLGPLEADGELLVIATLRDITERKRAEAALAESEVRYRRLTENAPDIVYSYRFAPEQCFDYLSPAVTEITGYTPEELCGDAELIRAIVHPDDWALFTKIPESGEPVTSLTRWRARDGSELLIELHDVPVLDPEGAVVGVEGIARDITRERQAAEDLRKSEAQLRLALAGAELVVWKWDLRTGEAVFAGEMDRLFAVAEPPTDFAEILERVHPDDHAVLMKAIDGSLERGPASVDVRVIGDDGVARWTTSRGDVVRDEAGEPSVMFGVTFDVTERRLAEAALEETTEALEAIFRRSPVAIVTADDDGRVIRWNPAAERMFGWSEAELIGRPLPHIPPEERDRVAALIDRALAGESLTSVETRRLCKDGTVKEVSLSLSALQDGSGEPGGLLGMLVDVSDEAAMRRELQESYELLQRLDGDRRLLLARLVRAQEEERQRIAADIHDDSVQVLTGLALRLELMARGIDDPDLLGQIEELGSTARASIARLRHLMFELYPPALDGQGFEAALRMHLEEMHERTGIDFELAGEMLCEPDAETRSMAYRIAQEALVNVSKHAHADRVEVAFRAVPEGLTVRVVDDGIGFADGQGVESSAGHLGLTSMRERAEMAGGWWRIDSTPGQGAKVEFFVPASPAPPEADSPH